MEDFNKVTEPWVVVSSSLESRLTNILHNFTLLRNSRFLGRIHNVNLLRSGELTFGKDRRKCQKQPRPKNNNFLGYIDLFILVQKGQPASAQDLPVTAISPATY